MNRERIDRQIFELRHIINHYEEIASLNVAEEAMIEEVRRFLDYAEAHLPEEKEMPKKYWVSFLIPAGMTVYAESEEEAVKYAKDNLDSEEVEESECYDFIATELEE